MNLEHGKVQFLANPEEPKIALLDIKKLESQLKFVFPQSFKSILLECNGGTPTPNCVVCNEKLFQINSFYTFKEILNYRNLYDDCSYPKGYEQDDLIPFAYDNGSGTFAFSKKKNELGFIYFFYLEEVATVYGTWNSFDAFMNSFIDC